MLLLLEIKNITALEAMAVSIPEPAGLLASGITLVIAAVLLRSFFARSEKVKAEQAALKKA